MDQIDAFLAMGGYAAYVWPAYAVALVILAAIATASLRGLRATEAAVRDAESRLNRARLKGAEKGPKSDDA